MTWTQRLLGRRPVHPTGDLSAYADGALRPDEARAVEAHLAGCRSCRAALAEVQAVRTAVRSLSRPEPARSFRLTAADVAARSQQRRAAAAWHRGYRALRISTAAVLVLLLALTGLDLLFISSAAPRPSRAPTQGMAAESSKAASDSGVDRPRDMAAIPAPSAAAGPAPAGGPSLSPTGAASNFRAATPAGPVPEPARPTGEVPQPAASARPRITAARGLEIALLVAAVVLAVASLAVRQRVRRWP
jgi:hypothetical protein